MRGVYHMNIYKLPLGVEHGYIIQGEGVVMIDGGAPNKAKAFINGLKNRLKPLPPGVTRWR